jgi:hypothetical protein
MASRDAWEEDTFSHERECRLAAAAKHAQGERGQMHSTAALAARLR